MKILKFNKKNLLLPIILIAAFSINQVYIYAHVGTVSAPTTPCISLDSLDLGTHISNQVDQRLSGKASSTALSLFTTRGTGVGSTYVRNTGVWTNATTSVDWTGISPYNTSHGLNSVGTLISPRHVIFAAHVQGAPGSRLVFVDNNNVVYERTLSAIQFVSGTVDITIGVLDSDVPDSVTYYPIMSFSNAKDYLQKFYGATQYDYTMDIPIVAVDSEKKALVHSLVSIGSSTVPYIVHSRYTTGNRSAFGEELASPDSGNPMFMIIDGQAVLIGAHHTSANSDYAGGFITQINNAMTSLGGSYQLTQYTPNCFTQYTTNHIPSFTGTSANRVYIDQLAFSTSTVLKTFTATDADIGDTLNFSLVSLSSNLGGVIESFSIFHYWNNFGTIKTKFYS